MPETPQIWIALSREEAEHLQTVAAVSAKPPFSEDAGHALALKLAAALNSEQGEGRTQHRVVGETRQGQPCWALCVSLAEAKSRAEERAAGDSLTRPWKNVRIQSRSVFSSDWVDCDGEAAK